MRPVDTQKATTTLKNVLNNPAVTQFNSGSKSIVSAARGNVFEFPVFVSDTVPLDFATATNSLLEQIYASYLQMAISIKPTVDSEVVRTGNQFAHLKSDTNKYLEHTDMSYAHDACHAKYEEDGVVFEFDMISVTDQEATIINEQCDYQPLSEFSHYFQEARDSSLLYDDRYDSVDIKMSEDNDEPGTMVKTGETIHRPSDFEVDELDRKAKRAADDDKRAAAKHSREMRDAEAVAAQKARADKRQDEKHKWDKDEHKWRGQEEGRKRRKEDRDIETHKREGEKHAIDKKIKASQFVDETKIQKLNTMKPLMMTVNMHVMDKNGGLSKAVEYIVGVKTHSRVIDSDILPEVAEYPLKEMNKISRKAKWRAGELKFFRDIVFQIKQKKQTAIDNKDPRRKWYRRLYNLAHMKGDASAAAYIKNNGSIFKSLFKKGSAAPTGIIPNVTMVITQSDVDNVKSQTGIDLLKGSTARNFCDELFLISLVVIDTDAESIKILMPDLHSDFEIHSLASVTKQLSMLDTSGTKVRDMLKALG